MSYKTIILKSALGLFFFLSVAGYTFAQSGDLPVPPDQNLPWTPPASGFTPETIAAAELMFHQGLADPRGCEYREIWINGQYYLATDPIFKTHGWVFPSGVKGVQYGIAWNGLVYPLVKVGAVADLEADVTNMVKLAIPSTGKPEESLNVTSYTSAALLLRLGKWNLAHSVYGSLRHRFDPYSELANERMFALYYRALVDHVSGDDHEAMMICEELLSFRNVEARNVTLPFASFLSQLPALAEDEKRRLAEPPHLPAWKHIGPLPHGPADVPGLIQDMEDCYDESDVIGNSLVLAGDDSVGPLLDCLEHDKRFARCVGLDQNPTLVRDIAFKLITKILNIQFDERDPDYVNYTDFSLQPEAFQTRTIKELKAYWKSIQGFPVPEQWFRVLKNDDVGLKLWESVADKIVQVKTPEKAGNSLLSGEELRKKTDPSVSDLIRRRIDGIHSTKAGFDRDTIVKYQLAADLAKWDAKGNLTELSSLCQDLEQNLKLPQDQEFVPCLVVLLEARTDGGDSAALPEYASWIETIPVDRLWTSAFTENLTEVLVHHSGEPAMEALAEKLLAPQSPWLPLMREDGLAHREFFKEPLANMKAFRAEILTGLGDKTVLGTIKFTGGLAGDLKMSDWKASYIDLQPDIIHRVNDPPPPGTICQVRRCDIYAYLLDIPGAPSCRLYWPEKRKDAAIQKAISLLDKIGK